MKRLTRYLLPVIILIAIVFALGVLGIAGSMLATLGKLVIDFFVKNWDYTIIIIVTSLVTSVICAIVDEYGARNSSSRRNKHTRNYNLRHDTDNDQ